jgi:iron-sulfur cluster repair protein YtfE (RIC family)
MKEAPTFSSLARDHIELNELFNRHQRALFTRDVDLAVSTLARFNRQLERHIEYEERKLLPLYADKSAETAGGTLEIFQAEHRKLREDATNLMRLTESLYDSEDLVGSAIDLLDGETLFKGLLHHHSAREQNLLFPRLDERTTEEERRVWLARN